MSLCWNGRQPGLRSRWGKPRVGSSPISDTKYLLMCCNSSQDSLRSCWEKSREGASPFVSTKCGCVVMVAKAE